MKIAAFHNLGSGGAKRALYGLVKYLAESGHQVEVFAPSTANEEFLPLRAVAHCVRIFPVRTTPGGIVSSSAKYLPPIPPSRSLADLERAHKTIAHAINEGKYGAVFVEQDRYTSSPFVLRFLAKPTVYYCPQPSRWGEAIWQTLKQPLRQSNGSGWLVQWARRQMAWYAGARIACIDRENASAASHILTSSFFSRESILRSYGLNSFVSYLGVDTTVFRRLERKKEDYVLSVGSCDASKGYDFIIRALAKLEQHVRPRLVIVSNTVDTRWRQWLERLAASEDVIVEFKTLLPDEDLVELYNRAVAFLYAPYLEPFGLAPLEAMACGTAVVAVKEGGVRETVIHAQTGTLVERDEAAFAEAVRELLVDAARRDRVEKEAGECVRAFWTLRHAGQRLLANLHRVTNGKNSEPNGHARIGGVQ